MGSGSKGQSTQTYTPAGATGAASKQTLTAAQNAANTPFGTPVAPVAGFTPDQYNAFAGVRGIPGMAQPYFDAASNYVNQSAQTIGPQDIYNYYNPFAQNVFAAQDDLFGKQMNQATGQLTQAAGGVGADRIAVGQAELGRQQLLARGQTASDLFGSALSAAQQEKARQAQAGFGLASFGPAAQNSALQGYQSLLGTGGIQQQLAQSQLNAQYQNELQRIAWPYQNAQFLSGITAQQAPVMGGTTTTTPAQPSIWSQIGGAGLAAAGLMSGNPAPLVGGLGMGTGKGGGSGATPQMGGWYGQGGWGGAQSGFDQYGNSFSFADGGAVNPYAPFQGYQLGGGPILGLSPADYISSNFPMAGEINAGADVMGDPRAARGALQGYGQSIIPQMQNVPMPRPRPNVPILPGTQPGPSNPFAALAQNDSIPMRSSPGALPGTALPYDDIDAAAEQPMPGGGGGDGPAPLVGGPSQAPQNPYQVPQMPASEMPYPDATERDAGQTFARSPWAALTQAGLATMAGTSPWAGINIGKGGLEGMKFLENQRKDLREEENLNLRAKQLWQQAQQFGERYNRMTAHETAQEERLKREHEDKYGRMTPAERLAAQREERVAKLERDKFEQEQWAPTGAFDDHGNAILYNKKTGETRAGAVGPPGSSDTADLPPEEYLKTLSPERRALLEKINRGEIPAPSASALRSPRVFTLLNQLARAYPGFDATVWKTRNETSAAFAKGREGVAVTGLNTVAGHMGDLAETMRRLAGHNLKPWNRLENAIQDTLGQDALVDFKLARTAVADELARIFQGAGVAAESEKDRWLEVLDDARSPAQFRRAMGRLQSLINSRMESLEYQHDRGMGYDPSHPKSGRNTFLNPKAKKSFESIKKYSKATPEPMPKDPSKWTKGNVYITPKGELEWTGDKWVDPYAIE